MDKLVSGPMRLLALLILADGQPFDLTTLADLVGVMGPVRDNTLSQYVSYLRRQGATIKRVRPGVLAMRVLPPDDQLMVDVVPYLDVMRRETAAYWSGHLDMRPPVETSAPRSRCPAGVAGRQHSRRDSTARTGIASPAARS